MSPTFKSLSLLALAAIGYSTPIDFTRREGVCNPQNMEVGKSRTDCPRKNTVDGKGHCSKPIRNVPGKEGCTGYCEVRITMSYGQEVPFSSSTCPELTTCRVDKAESVTITNTYTINVGITGGVGKRDETSSNPALSLLPREEGAESILKASFDVGASYSWSKAVSYGTTRSYLKELSANQCGYWTFVPFIMESCGTLTTASRKEMAAGYYMSNRAPYCDKDELKDTENWCNKTPYQDENGQADGRVIFVKVDCGTNALLPMDQQDEVYKYPGVSTAPPKKREVV
ncbi:hypothetical protein GQ43DRAFT_467956 [Delitschia confertaspora ATCC 74209]|uniref:Uncharacterized protein n=1 Tax=Delitschia confertaspora ATCC 74209 TaxID=1513339 RepID=A0A9P4JY45_9PLEO|nr:hypothetical protein GQ43DRAFT_467956 [Delitschia confertaspora ATCC 74209]